MKGSILVQLLYKRKWKIGGKTLEGLIEHTKKLGMDAVADAVDLIEKDSVVLINNDGSQKSYYSFPTRMDVKSFIENGNKFY